MMDVTKGFQAKDHAGKRVRATFEGTLDEHGDLHADSPDAAGQTFALSRHRINEFAALVEA